MKRMVSVVGALTALGLAAGCGKPHVTYRRIEVKKPEKGEGAVALATKVPGQRRSGLQSTAYMLVGNELQRVTEPGPNAILANEHYVSIAVEEVRIHGGGLVKPLVLTFKTDGVMPQGQNFQAILGRAYSRDEDLPYFRFNRPLIVDPFVYRGQPLIVDLALSTVSKEYAAKVDEAKKAWGDVRHVDPNDPKPHPVDATPIGTEGSEWIRAAFATTTEASSLPLVAGRYVVFSHPKPEELKDKVTFDERGLVWKDGGEPVKGVSFVTFLVNRRFRGPRRDTLVEQQKKTIETMLSNNNLDGAKSAIEKLPEFVDKDNTITNKEKEFNKELVKLYTLRMERKQLKTGDKSAFQAKTDELLNAMAAFKGKYKDMIEPSEVNDINFKMRRYQRERD